LIKTSLIITVFNRSQSLRKALLSLKNQSIKPDELILSDDGSEEDVINAISGIVRKFDFPVKYVRQANKGFRLAKARNNGVRNAVGDLIIFLDQDLIHTAGLIRTFITNLRENRFITGMPIWLDEEQSLKITEQKIINNDYLHLIDENLIDGIVKQFKKDKIYYYLHKLKLTNKPRMRGGFCAINKSDLEKINGYDEKYIGWGNEDDDVARRLYQMGAEGFNPFRDEYTIHLYHPSTNTGGVRVNLEYDAVRDKEIKKGKYRCEFGLDNPYDEDTYTVIKLN